MHKSLLILQIFQLSKKKQMDFKNTHVYNKTFIFVSKYYSRVHNSLTFPYVRQTFAKEQ